MKKSVLILLVCLHFTVFAQPPGYYLSAAGLNGQPLRIALCGIIRSHTTLSYTPGLWDAYYTTDKKPDGKLWDIYSDVPGGTPAYEYTLGTGQCSGSSPSGENGCYNREHTWPQSKFGSAVPMQTDLFIVYPTDYFVNNRRGDFPYGEVGTATQTFTNGSRICNNVYSGAPSGSCFEPIDSFKGDIARNYFYISTCYRNDSAAFIDWEMATQVNLAPWTVQMLLEWHHNDPVSKKEIDRNNAVYALQGNRNPFIDNPEYADCIWGAGNCTVTAVRPAEKVGHQMSVSPNPAGRVVTITVPQNTANSPCSLAIYDMSGRLVYRFGPAVPATGAIDLNVENWSKGIYLVREISGYNTEIQKLQID